jgi:hypothetical protein
MINKQPKQSLQEIETNTPTNSLHLYAHEKLHFYGVDPIQGLGVWEG